MTPIEAARELEDVGLVEFDEDDKRSSTDFIRCTVCQTVTKSDTNISHRDDCPVPMLPKIVAALEAAERLNQEVQSFLGDRKNVSWQWPELAKPADALDAALKGDEVPA